LAKFYFGLELPKDKIFRCLGWIQLAALGAILAASGACGLVYELVWTRMLSLILGSNSLGVAAALAGFMGGLAGGSLLAGRFLDRKPHLALKLYAFLELGIGLYAVFSPLLLSGIQVFYVRFYGYLADYHFLLILLRFCLALVMMGIPAALMGGTLPAVITHLLPKLKRVGFKVGLFYGLNTLGGALGAFATGFFLLPGLGISATLMLTAGLNILLALLVFYGLKRDWFGIQEGEEPEEQAAEPVSGVVNYEPAGSAGSDRFLLFIGAGVIGFCGLAYEVIWMRLLNLTFGSSVYAFSTMLTAFLAGIGLGSLCMASRLNREEEPWRLFGWFEMGIAFFGLLLIPVFGRLPLVFPILYNTFYRNFDSFQFLIFGIYFLLMIGPAFLMGASLPLLLRAGIYSTGRAGGGVGSVYAINALGAISGSLLATFLMIPLLGTRVSLIAVSSLNLAVGAWALWRSAAGGVGKRLWPVAVPLAVLMLVIGYSQWNPRYLTAGFYTTNLVNLFNKQKVKIADLLKTGDVLYYREGISSTVTVKKIPSSGIRSIQINGKTDASTGRDVKTQYLVGYLPYLWKEKIRDVLVIGLGSGMTVAAALEFQPDRVTCVEIEDAVREAAEYFRDFNRDCLNNPRLNLIIGDARNHMLAVSDQYDAIISQPSNPWVAGEANLFTRENYQSAYRRLKPGGLMVQWFHFYSMSTRDFKIALHTFREVFPGAHLWWLPQCGDVIMLAAKDRPLRYDFQILQHRLTQHPRLKKDLEKVGIDTLDEVFKCFAMGEKTLAEFTAGVPLNTDDHPRIEFSAPKYIYHSELAGRNQELLKEKLESIFSYMDNFHVVPAHRYQTYTALAENYLIWKSYGPLQEVASRLMSFFPKAAAGFYYQGLYWSVKGELERAEKNLTRALRIKESAQSRHYSLGSLSDPRLAQQESREYYLEKLKANPGAWAVHYYLGLTYARERNYPAALRYFNRAVERGGRSSELFYYRGLILYFRRNLLPAERDIKRALKINPRNKNAGSLITVIQEEIRESGAAGRKPNAGLDI